MISKPAFMRPSFQRNWNTRKISQNHMLTFCHEAELYFSNNKDVIDSLQRKHVEQIVQQLTSYSGQSIVSAIPCFASEDPDIAALSNHINHIGRGGGHVVILVNAGSRELEVAVNRLSEKLKSSLGRRCSQRHYSLVAAVFNGPQTIGRIRKILNDAIIRRALEFKVDDPIIISNDVDCCYTPPGYIASLKRHFSDPCLDLLSGPLYYGYSPEGEDFLGLDPATPELFLGNRVLEARRLCRLNGIFYGEMFFTTEGPHTAFRASAYCAAGGYDDSLEQAEDDELGIAIFALRQRGEFPFPTARNAVYANDFWFVTDPRRQLLAIANGLSIIDTWREYPIKKRAGHNISSVAESLQSKNRLNAISMEELNSLAGSQQVPNDTWRSVLEVFLRGISDQKLSPNVFKYYLTACGVSIDKAYQDEDVATLASRSGPDAAFVKAICRFSRFRQTATFKEARA